MRYLIKISYNGRNYSGFQIQKDCDTIQLRLESSLSKVLDSPIAIIASGRTDAGVSAINQICHFDIDGEIDIKRTIGYTNSILPRDIRVLEIIAVEDNFHARFNAKQKTYEYYFYIGEEIPLYEEFATNIGFNVDINLMKNACKHFIGEHDFSAFCSSNTEVQDKTRTIFNADIIEVNDNLYKFSITGNGFLYNMVRIIMGTIVNVGLGKICPGDIEKIIESKDRKRSGKTMVSKGLVLKNVIY